MKVSSAKVVAKPGSQSRFGFVTMRQEKEAAKCIEELNGKQLKGSSITVELVTTASCTFYCHRHVLLLYYRPKEDLH